MANQYPNEEFQGIYDSILASMGDDATLKANIEAALRPSYDMSRQQLDRQMRENNAAIDVDAASRGMGTSSWVTDAKLQQLRGLSDDFANLEASYNSTLYGQLLDAIRERDDNAYSQAMQMYQLNHKGGSGGGSGSPTIGKTPLTFDEWLSVQNAVWNNPLKVRQDAANVQNAIAGAAASFPGQNPYKSIGAGNNRATKTNMMQ